MNPPAPTAVTRGTAARDRRRRSRRRRHRVAALLLAATGAVGGVLVWSGLHADAPPAPLPTRTFDRASLTPLPAPVVTATRYASDRLLIPSLGVDAPLVPEPVGAGGDLVIPGDPRTVGRWAEGPAVGSTEGVTLLAGHVSVAGAGDGALVRLVDVAPGAVVVTTDGSGRPYAWRVESLLVRAKDDLPSFPRTGPRRLAIVTCGGPLLRLPSGNTYRDNVIAYAVPA